MMEKLAHERAIIFELCQVGTLTVYGFKITITPTLMYISLLEQSLFADGTGYHTDFGCPYGTEADKRSQPIMLSNRLRSSSALASSFADSAIVRPSSLRKHCTRRWRRGRGSPVRVSKLVWHPPSGFPRVDGGVASIRADTGSIAP